MYWSVVIWLRLNNLDQSQRLGANQSQRIDCSSECTIPVVSVTRQSLVFSINVKHFTRIQDGKAHFDESGC